MEILHQGVKLFNSVAPYLFCWRNRKPSFLLCNKLWYATIKSLAAAPFIETFAKADTFIVVHYLWGWRLFRSVILILSDGRPKCQIGSCSLSDTLSEGSEKVFTISASTKWICKIEQRKITLLDILYIYWMV